MHVDLARLRVLFKEAYPDAGEPFVCRAPGRVNLIGEHMDYNGLPVLPMAIQQQICIAFAGRPEPTITLKNVCADFAPVSFENMAKIPPSAQGACENYCKAAVHGLNRHFEVTKFQGMDLLITSDLPMAAGLSSSSAMVVACALAYLAILDIQVERDISRKDLADLLARAEHYVGTRGGGMDQTCILHGAPGHACKIDFFPLRVELAPVPEDCAIVVCDSMVKVEKSGAGLQRFNAGPRLCALACALVEKQAQEEFGEEIELHRLGDLWLGPLCLLHEEGRELCMRAIPEERIGMAEIVKRLGMSEGKIRERYIADTPEPAEGFPLRARLRHQITEYRRVETARDALIAGAAEEFGQLMNASHGSCAHDFGISSPELDTLVECARKAGSLGSRLTGAGFGGATVNLVPKGRVAAFVEAITQSYYRDYKKHAGPAAIFVAEASEGAGYVAQGTCP